MRYIYGQTLYCCRNVQGQAVKGEVAVKVVGYNARLAVYAVQFKDETIGILQAKVLRDVSMWEAAEEAEKKEYARLKKKYENPRDN